MKKTMTHEELRAEIIKGKMGAVWIADFELDGIINKSALAKKYFNKSQSWFSQRLHNCMVQNQARSFKESEYAQLAEAYRNIAKLLNQLADDIDNAKMD